MSVANVRSSWSYFFVVLSALLAGGAIAVIGPLLFVLIVPVVWLLGLLLWPGRRVTAGRAVLYGLLLAYLAPLLILEKIYSTIGHSPIYLPDVLIALAAIGMLFQQHAHRVRPFPIVGLAIVFLAAYSVYVGWSRGYPDAIKGVVLAFYPLVAVIVAGWLAAQPNIEGLLSTLPRYMFPLITLGLAGLLVAQKADVIAAAAGLYLGVAAAFATVPGMPRRKLLGLSVVLGSILLIGFHAERGPALAIVIGALVSWMASWSRRGHMKVARVSCGILAVAAALGLAISFGVVSPTRLPVAGQLINRAFASNANSTSISAANNISIRRAMWSYALSEANTNPFFGVGAYHLIEVDFQGNNIALDPADGVHNSFIGYAFYAGYPAALLVVFAFALGAWRMWLLRDVSVYAPALLGALAVAVVTALTNVALETTYIGGPSWLLLGVAFGVAGSSLRAARSVRSHPLPSPGR